MLFLYYLTAPLPQLELMVYVQINVILYMTDSLSLVLQVCRQRSPSQAYLP